MNRVRVYLLCLLISLFGVSTFADGSNHVYELSGRFVALGADDDLGLDGTRFRLSVTIDPAAAPESIERAEHGQTAVYKSIETVLHVSGSSNASLKGALRSTEERVEIAETYGGDTCITFGASFSVDGRLFSVPPVCFAAGALTGIQLPGAALSGRNAAGFRATHSRGAAYLVSAGAIRVRGGAR
jgi:hypothetical protein